MGIEFTPQSTTSVSAVAQYISLRPENRYRHTANILVYANGKDYGPGMRFVFIKATENTAEIIIEDLHTIYSTRTNTFTAQDDIFSFNYGVLNITHKGLSGQQITIEITGK